jgi:hypothetical protein
MTEVAGFKKLISRDEAKLSKFRSSTYADKEKLKLTNIEKYNHLLHLIEQDHENKTVLSHHQYRNSTAIFSREIAESINPAFFVTIKYIDRIATDPERVSKIFGDIKYEIQRTKDYKFLHYIEQGSDKSYHSHIFISNLKNKQKSKQIEWLKGKLIELQDTSKYSIANAESSVKVDLYDDVEKNLSVRRRTNYVVKQDRKQYLSLDITNSDNLCQPNRSPNKR